MYGASLGAWSTELDGANAVINLAGRSVNCRYTRANRRAIVVPGRLVASGFTFAFSDWPAAAADLCQRWPSRAENPAFDVS